LLGACCGLLGAGWEPPWAEDGPLEESAGGPWSAEDGGCEGPWSPSWPGPAGAGICAEGAAVDALLAVLLVVLPLVCPLVPSVLPGATEEITAAAPAVAAAAPAIIHRRVRRMRASAASRASLRDSPENFGAIHTKLWTQSLRGASEKDENSRIAFRRSGVVLSTFRTLA
jgi:hypothetical protein